MYLLFFYLKLKLKTNQNPYRLENRQPSMGSPAPPVTGTPGSPTLTTRTGVKNRN